MSSTDRAAPGFGAVRMRRALAVAGCGVLSVGISGCESTEQESARIGRESQVAAARAALHTLKPARRAHGRGPAGARAANGRSRGQSG
jgi:hypothetical protein